MFWTGEARFQVQKAANFTGSVVQSSITFTVRKKLKKFVFEIILRGTHRLLDLLIGAHRPLETVHKNRRWAVLAVCVRLIPLRLYAVGVWDVRWMPVWLVKCI